MKCYVCQGTGGVEYHTREMMIGLRDESRYWECERCQCVQIVEAPQDLSIYYPRGYYSFSSRFASWKRLLYWAHFHAPRLTRLLHPCPVDVAAVVQAKPQSGARILDVGCGGGRLVRLLRAVGFEACGIDPFLAEPSDCLRRATLDQVEGDWDLILMNHSLEHMPDQRKVLECVREKLAAGGRCIVRIPVAAWAWRNYHEHWVQLDPPRHLLVHSAASFKLLAESAGFSVDDVAFDSTEFQIWGSELYKNDIPLEDERAKSYFSVQTLKEFRRKARTLNAEADGDQAVFHLAVKRSV